MKRLRQKLDEVGDRIFVTILILFALVIMAFIIIGQVLFPKSVDRAMDKFFEPEDDEDIVSGYRKFQERHPMLAWPLKWPLRLFAM